MARLDEEQEMEEQLQRSGLRSTKQKRHRQRFSSSLACEIFFEVPPFSSLASRTVDMTKPTSSSPQKCVRFCKQPAYLPVGIDPNLWPKLQRRYVLLVGLLLLVGLGIAVYFLCSNMGDSYSRTRLLPPDPEYLQPPSPSKLHVFRKGAVCSDAPPCSEIGRDILMKQGSVVDSAIAVLLCNGIVNCHSMGLGGGFLMTLYVNKTVITLNARESAPTAARNELYLHDDLSTHIGSLAVGVPGELKGYWEAHKKYGRLPWAELVEPALKVCEEGYNMTKHQADSLTMNPNVPNDTTLREVFMDPKTGAFYTAGTLIKHKKLCETLRIIAQKGGDELYTGSLAKLMAEDIKEMGGIITEKDLRNYKVSWDKPVAVDLHGEETVYSVPPPGSGILLGFILNILNGYNFTSKDIQDVNSTILTYHRIVEAFKYAYGQRTEIGDPHYVDTSMLVRDLSSLPFGESIRQNISDNSTKNDPHDYGAVFYAPEDNGTAHISIIAPNGDAVSVTSTVNIYFGAGVTSKQTGIILNSGIDDFSFPHKKNYFGLPGSPANKIEPGKKSLSSMCPTIIINKKTGNVSVVIGASGGTKITTAVASVIMRILWFGQDIKQAVDASRFHHQLFPMQIAYEYGIQKQVLMGLEKLGHRINRYRDRGSIICAITKKEDKIFANADFRKGGEVFGMD